MDKKLKKKRNPAMMKWHRMALDLAKELRCPNPLNASTRILHFGLNMFDHMNSAFDIEGSLYLDLAPKKKAGPRPGSSRPGDLSIDLEGPI